MLDIFVSLNFLKHKDVNYMEAIEDKILKKIENLSTNQLVILIISSGLKFFFIFFTIIMIADLGLNTSKTNLFCKNLISVLASRSKDNKREFKNLSSRALDLFWSLLFYDCIDTDLVKKKKFGIFNFKNMFF